MSGYATGMVLYPCDRGVPNNVATRGWHYFLADAAGRIVCAYCGAVPANFPGTITTSGGTA